MIDQTPSLSQAGYTGTHADTETFMTGTNRALDPGKYFIILTDLLGNGLSSSPSNTPPCEQPRLARITIQDDVGPQHQLVTETLGNHRLRLGNRGSM
jgi:homoserine O-acetyltransferase